MLMYWIFILTCASQVLCRKSFYLDRYPGKSQNTFLNILKQRYSVGYTKNDVNAGSPLLLTPYIEQNKLKEARSAAYVNPELLLPGVESYAGYLTVNKEYNSNLFIWYFPVMNKSVEDTPWILWLQGGPGASSLYGLFTEIGPIVVADDLSLKEATYSWGRNHSLLFIDNPVGTGFSFTDDEQGYATEQTTVGEHLYWALQQFLKIFPSPSFLRSSLRKAPLFIAGESYAGKHIPSLGIQIHWHKKENLPINLQGLAIGNGLTDPITLQRYSFFIREVGLVDDKVADEIREYETEIVDAINEKQLSFAKNLYDILLDTIQTKSHIGSIYNYLADKKFDINETFLTVLERDQFRRAVHVGNKTFNPLNMEVYWRLEEDMMNSAKPWLEELLDNYRVMLYNGHLDVIVAYHPSVNTYSSLNFSGTSEYKLAERMPWYHNSRLAGYYKTAGNLTEVMVRGAGHMVPEDQPAAALGLISAFARGLSLENDTSSLVPK